MTLGHLRRNLVAYVALAVALGTGTAYAAEKIPNGSITTKKLANNAVSSTKLKNGAVKAIDLKGGAVTSFTIANGSVTSDDLTDNTVSSADLRDGTIGSADIKDDSIVRRDINDGVVPQDADIFVSGTGLNPSAATQQGDPNTFTFTLPRNAKVVIEFFAGEIGVPCSGGEGAVGLYIDGAPQPGTLTPAPATGDPGALQIVTNQFLNAGTHTLTTREQCAVGPYGTNVPDLRVTWSVHLLAR